MTRQPIFQLLRIITGISLFFTAAFVSSCEEALYASFLIPEKSRRLMDVRDSVAVHLQLSASDMLVNELEIINNSRSTVYMNPKEFFFAVNGRDIRVPVEEDYDAYIMKLNSKATLLCNESETSYKCVDAITARNNDFKGKGFNFNSIEPGKERKGYVAFDFPNPLNDSPLKTALMAEFRRNYKTLKGEVNIELIIGDHVETVTFPVEIGLYNSLRRSPFERLKVYLK